MLLPESNNRVSVHMSCVSWGIYEADIEEGANNRGRKVVLGQVLYYSIIRRRHSRTEELESG